MIMFGLSQKIVLVGLLAGLAFSVQAATKVVYRYKNNDGTLVMDNKIPAEFASKGYEIVSTTGKLIKVVPPSLTKEQAEKQRAEKQAREERLAADIELRRSYSAVADIDAAKERNLASLSANIAILNSNLDTTRQELNNETARAASFERSGRKVTSELLKKIDSLHNKEKDLTQQIKQREKEYQAVSDKFEQDKKRFIEITTDASSSSISSSMTTS